MITHETLNFHAKQATAEAKVISEDNIKDTCVSAIKALKSDNFDRGIWLAQGVLSRLKDFNRGCPQLAGRLLVDKIDKEMFFRSAALERLIGADDNTSRQIARCGALREMLNEFDTLHLGAGMGDINQKKKVPEKKVDEKKLAELTTRAIREGDFILHTAWETGDDASKKRIPEPAPGCPKCLGASAELSDFMAGTSEPKPRQIDSFKALSGLYRPENFGIFPVDMDGFRDGRKFKK